LGESFFSSFEAQTDGLAATEAQGELLRLVRDERERASAIRLWDERGKQVLGFTIVLWEIEDMLNPKGHSFWRLEIKQRRRGKRTVPAAVTEDILNSYEVRVHELYEAGAPSPKKTALGELAKEYGVSDTTIREIVRRAQGKKPKR
jgi:hypothetical protein